MMRQIKYIMLFVLLLGPALLHGHGDEEHEAVPVKSDFYFSSEAVSDKYEVLVRYETIHGKEDAHLELFLSEFESNRPVNNAALQITSPQDKGLKFTVHPDGTGRYLVETQFPAERSYDLAVKIEAEQGADLILVKQIEIGKEQPVEAVDEEKSGFNIWIIAIALLIGVLIGFLMRNRKGKAGAVTIYLVLLYILIPSGEGIAHEEGHDSEKKDPGFSNSFIIPKETQFLFDVITSRTKRGAFNESTTLFGTIVPGNKGQSLITSPQNGRIVSLPVSVGQDVQKGQLLASIEQNIDAGTQIGLMTERNNIIAEYEAASKNLERLNSISDIVAGKELDEAKARFSKAKQNMDVLKGNAGKVHNIYSPIDGVISNYTVTNGAIVNQGQSLFSVTNLSVVYAEAQVFDRDADKVMQAQKFSVECANDDHKTTAVTFVAAEQMINVTNQSQKMLFEVKNPEHVFKLGEFVNIRAFSANDSQQIGLPSASITEINGRPVAFVKQSAERFMLSYILQGDDNGTFTTIHKGISEGERVVVNGSYQLKMIYLNQ